MPPVSVLKGTTLELPDGRYVIVKAQGVCRVCDTTIYPNDVAGVHNPVEPGCSSPEEHHEPAPWEIILTLRPE